jgi:hypothetical protein
MFAGFCIVLYCIVLYCIVLGIFCSQRCFNQQMIIMKAKHSGYHCAGKFEYLRNLFNCVEISKG